MNKEEWTKQLKEDQDRSSGLGTYVIRPCTEAAAELLAEHDTELSNECYNGLVEKAKAFDKIKTLYEENADGFDNTGVYNAYFIRQVYKTLCDVNSKLEGTK